MYVLPDGPRPKPEPNEVIVMTLNELSTFMRNGTIVVTTEYGITLVTLDDAAKREAIDLLVNAHSHE